MNWRWVLIWLAGIVLAGFFDARVAHAMRESGSEDFWVSNLIFREIVKAPGVFKFTLAVALLVAIVHRDRWLAALFVLIAVAPTALNPIIKWTAGRIRPFKFPGLEDQNTPFTIMPFNDGIAGLLYGKNWCFPSGHAALAFATAAALGMLWPRSRWRFAWYAIATVVSIERVAENAHWLSDIVAGAALGVGGAFGVKALLDSWKINLLTSRS